MAVAVLDTNVLIYVVGGDDHLRLPARRLIRHIADGEIRATTTHQVIQEFAHVFARRRDRTEAVRVARSYVDLLRPLLTTSEDDLRLGLAWWRDLPGLGAFDAVLAAACADSATTRVLVTADRGIVDSGAVPSVALDDPQLWERLGL